MNFFASWCEACKQEASDIQAVYSEWHSKDSFTVIGVDTQDESGSPASFYTKFHWTFESVWDDGEKIYKGWFASAGMTGTLPTSVWIKPDGTVQDIIIGQMTRQQMEQEMGQM